jgi:hypothetical protein
LSDVSSEECASSPRRSPHPTIALPKIEFPAPVVPLSEEDQEVVDVFVQCLSARGT